MAAIDPRKTWRLAEARHETEEDPILRSRLALLIRHMKAESVLDMEMLLSTIAEDAHYHFWTSHGLDEHIGKAAVGAFYETIAASGMHRLHHDVTNLVVDRHCIVTEGEMAIAYPGALLNAMKGLDLEPDAHYLFRSQLLIVWPIDDDGLFIGEDSYGGADGFAGIEDRKIAPDDIIKAETLGPMTYPDL